MDENNTNKSYRSTSNLPSVHNNILELVQKNKIIPDFLNNLTPNDVRLLRLKKAIGKGNFRAKIWNHPQCNLYLIYLINKKIIPFWQGITAYVYLIAKMQYTKTQAMRAEDQDVKFDYQVKIVSLVKAGKMTLLGYEYLLGVTHTLEKLNVFVDFQELVNYVLALPPIEQWLIKTEFDHHLMLRESKQDSNRLVWVLINNLPLIQKISTGNYEDSTTEYLIPSSSMINYFLQTFNAQPLRMRPVFGNPGLATLYEWHAQDYHPVSLYAPQILSNPKNADGYRCGPLGMWLHDIGHTFWGSMLSKTQREYIFTTYIPALRYLKVMAEEFYDEWSIDVLKEVEIKAYDFDLTAITDYADGETRFATYLAHTLGKNPIYPRCVYTGVYEFEPIGKAEGDILYFLLHYGLFTVKTPDAYKEVYKNLINFIPIGPSYRNQSIVNALKTLAKNAVINPEALFADDPPLFKIDRKAWQMLLNSNLSGEELWMQLTGDVDRAEELLELIERGLNFFHPYLPMTAKKRLALLDSLEKQRPMVAKISKNPCNNANIKSKFQPQFFSIHVNDSSVPLAGSRRYKYN